MKRLILIGLLMLAACSPAIPSATPQPKIPKQLWTMLILEGLGATQPTVADGTVYFSSGGQFIAVDAADGYKKWAILAVACAPAAVDNGLVCFGSPDRNLYAVVAHSGEVKWKYHSIGYICNTATFWNG